MKQQDLLEYFLPFGYTIYMKAAKPNLFKHHDYRMYLQECFAFLKDQDPQFSLRKLSEESGVSQAAISLVLSQKRSLSVKSAELLALAMGLNASEKSYFKLLVQMAEGKTQEDRLKAYQKIKRFSEYQDQNENQVEAFKFLSEWYLVALRELAAHPEFKGNLKWIQKQLNFHVPLADLKEALQFLVKQGFLKKVDKNYYLQTDRHLDCLGGIFQLSLNRFHQQILDLSAQAMDSLPKEKRNFSGYTFLMNNDSYQEVLDLIEQAKQKIQAIEDRDRKKAGEKSVFHVENIVIPLSGKRSV